MTTVDGTPTLQRDPARTRTLWAGRSLIAIGVLHTALFVPLTKPSWSEWLSGRLARDNGNAQAMADFWALPGSFVVPLVGLGLMITKSAHEDRDVPRSVSLLLGTWSIANCALLFPSGFLLGLIPTGLLVAARRARR